MNCREFEGLMEGVLDGTLDREDHARCVDHASACASCFALVEPMGAMLAPVGSEPPASFSSAVFARTSRKGQRTPWAATWRKWMLRPRFASEAAYVGVVVLSLAAVTLDLRVAEARQVGSRAGVVLKDIRSEAGILLDHATSLLTRPR